MDIFEKWKVDIVRSLPIIRKGNRYIIVTMDYFLRQLEAKPLKAANVNTYFYMRKSFANLEHRGFYKVTEELIL